MVVTIVTVPVPGIALKTMTLEANESLRYWYFVSACLRPLVQHSPP